MDVLKDPVILILILVEIALPIAFLVFTLKRPKASDIIDLIILFLGISLVLLLGKDGLIPFFMIYIFLVLNNIISAVYHHLKKNEFQTRKAWLKMIMVILHFTVLFLLIWRIIYLFYGT